MEGLISAVIMGNSIDVGVVPGFRHRKPSIMVVLTRALEKLNGLCFDSSTGKYISDSRY